jgi:predicted ATPase
MINCINHADNVGIFKQFDWEDLDRINLIIGENDTGKSHLLKLLYATTRSVQEYGRKQSAKAPRWTDVLADKLRWTFQPPGFDLGQIVRKGEGNRLKVDCRICNESIYYSFGRATTKQINEASQPPGSMKPPETLFFPPKEVLTSMQAVAATREQLEITGFGDTYFDLIKALRLPTTRGRIQTNLQKVLNELETLFGGKIQQENPNEFIFRRGHEKYGMTQTAEGIKKIGILAQLIRNRSIQSGSVLFFDEPAAHLHPKATLKLVEMLYEMSKAGIQLFIATHSYTVLKQFELLAREHRKTVPLCVLAPTEEEGVNASFADLKDHIPENSIVDASVELFERNLDLNMAE